MDIYPMKVTAPINSEGLENINTAKGTVLSADNIEEINTSYYKKKGVGNTDRRNLDAAVNADSTVFQSKNILISGGDVSAQSIVGGSNAEAVAADNIRQIVLPNMTKKAFKGQKLPLTFTGNKLKVNFGWNVKNFACDVDVSAFMLDKSGKVVGDDYFVFYGQVTSPEKSITFKKIEDGNVIEVFDIDLGILNGDVQKIVFVMTINEALEKSLNFGMLKDAYMQITDPQANAEIASFLVEEYYDNITSMMMGEIYLHNGAWKFNAVGNGVNRDLAGLCELYGVNVV